MVTKMDKISELLAEAMRYSETGKVLQSEGQLKDAYVAVAQAIHLYHQVLALEEGDDDAFWHGVREAIFQNTVRRDDIKNMIFSVTANLDMPPEAPKLEEEATCSTSGKTDFEKYFTNKLENWEGGSGFKSIIGLDYLKQVLTGCKLLLPGSELAKRLRLEGAGQFNQHVLMYGPPGTGKTFIVLAYHQEAKPIKLIKVLPSDILNCFMGEAEKAIDALFKVASRNSPAIIFFDEIDGLFSCSKRDGGNVSLINQFLLHLGSTKDVQVIGATNSPWDLQEAIRRRFDHLIEVPLPTLPERKLLFQQYLGESKKYFSGEELDYAANETAGYSSSDVRRATNICLQSPTAKVLRAEAFRETVQADGTKIFVPCSKSEEGAKDMKVEDIVNYVEFPQLTFEDLKLAIRSSKASSDGSATKGSLQSKIAEFTKKFGTDGRHGGNVPEAPPPTEVSTPAKPITYAQEVINAMTLRGTDGVKCKHHDIDPKNKRPLASVINCTANFCVHKPYQVTDEEFKQLKDKEKKGTTHASFLLTLRSLQKAHEIMKKSSVKSNKNRTVGVRIRSIASMLLQLRHMQDVWADEKFDEFETYAKSVKRRQLQYIWIKTIKDLVNEKVYVESLESGAYGSTDQNNSPRRELSRIHRVVNVLGLPFQAVNKGFRRGAFYLVSKAKKLSRWHINYSNFELVEIMKEDGSKRAARMPCQRSDIDLFHWAGHGGSDVYVGVCELLHVHYTVKETGEHAANK